MIDLASSSPFYITGGTLPRNALSYVQRQADDDLLEELRHGHFCYVLTSRQMGKSSLMVRTAARLREEGVAVAVLDLTAVGQNLTAQQWYEGLLNLLARALDLEEELEAFWLAQERLSPLQKWMQGLRDVVLAKTPGRVVVFIDEIEAVRSLPFSADEFFAAIRECYNRRAEDPEYNRLSFCLLGVATPSDLIRDTRTTPFNIGKRIELTDFTSEEARVLAQGLNHGGHGEKPSNHGEHGEHGDEGKRLLERILYWTGGHPYLTQSLCAAVAERLPNQPATVSLVDEVCETLFLSTNARERDDNLIFVRERVLRSGEDTTELLGLYAKVHRGRIVADDETNPRLSVLKLSGIVRVVKGALQVRNRIYSQVFDATWVRDNLPDAEVRRQQAAYRRGVLRTAAVFGVILLAMGLLTAYALHQRNDAITHKRKADQAALKATNNEAKANRKEKEARELAGQLQSALNDVQKQRNAALAAAKRETIAKGHVKAALDAAQKARENALERLRASYFTEAQALRFSGRPGRQFTALELLGKAAELRPNQEEKLRLRNEAIAALALPTDLKMVRKWNRSKPGENVCGLDMARGRTFYTDAKGNITVKRDADGTTSARLRGEGIPVLFIRRISRDGRYALVGYEGDLNIVWDLMQQKPLWRRSYAWWVADFHPNGREMVTIEPDESVVLRELPSGRVVRRLDFANGRSVRYNPSGRRLAVCHAGGRKVSLLDFSSGVAVSLDVPSAIDDLAWQPDGDLLAGVCNNGHIYLWDNQTGALRADLKGHRAAAIVVAFNGRGDLLASYGWDNAVRLWDPYLGKQILECPVGASVLRFSPDDRHIEMVGAYEVSKWQVAESAICRRIHKIPGPPDGVWEADISPDGRLLAVGAQSGFLLVDLEAEREVARMREKVGTRCPLFAPDGHAFYTCNDERGRVWPIAREGNAPHRLRLGPPQRLPLPVETSYLGASLSRDGHTLAVSHQPENATFYLVRIIDLTGRRSPVVAATLDFDVHTVAISPDGRWVASGSWKNSGACVWDAHTGKTIFSPSLSTHAAVTFSPDGRWLVTREPGQYRFWTVGTWKPGPILPRSGNAEGIGSLTFLRKGLWAATSFSAQQVRLMDTTNWQQIATLESPFDEGTSNYLCASGNRLVIVRETYVEVWNLGRLRQRLKEMGLDWDAPPVPSERPHLSAPLQVTFLEPTPLQLKKEAFEEEDIGFADRMALIPTLLKQMEATPKNSSDYGRQANNVAWLMLIGPERTRNPARALLFAQKAIRLSPSNGFVIRTLGAAYYRLGRYEEAIQTFSAALKAGDDLFVGYSLFFLAMCHQKRGESQTAQEYYQRALSWFEAHTKFVPHQRRTIRILRAEAEVVLQIDKQEPK